MPKNGTEFSRYATTFHEIIDGKKTKMTIFTRDLLKMGLIPDDKDTINDIFPTLTNDKGKSFIEEPKAGLLRKYYHGTNDLTNLLPQLETEFDQKFITRYSKELQDYDDSKLIEFAHSYQLIDDEDDEDDIDNVTKAIAELYVSIIKNVLNKKRAKPTISEDNHKSNNDSIVLSYTFTEGEKKAFVQLCNLIKNHLNDLKRRTLNIDEKQHKLKQLTDSDKDKILKSWVEYQIKSDEKKFDNISSEIKLLCSELIELIKPKQRIDRAFPKLISFANNIGNDEYRITNHNKFRYNLFALMISNFNTCIDNIIRIIDKL